MAIMVSAGAGGTCCIMGLVHMETVGQKHRLSKTYIKHRCSLLAYGAVVKHLQMAVKKRLFDEQLN